MIGHLFNSQTQKIVTNETLKIFEKAKYGFYKLKISKKLEYLRFLIKNWPKIQVKNLPLHFQVHFAADST
jgi:hypothetical protein